MEIRVLRYFLAVVQEGTISGAANFLHLTQPTLSKQLMELENELGITLFERGNRKISLTEEGIYLANQAKEILALVDKTASNIGKEEIVTGDIYIGGGESEAMRLLAKCCSILMNRYPDVHVHLYSGNADELAEKLDNGLLDFGVVIDPTDKQKYDFIQLPNLDSWGVLMPSTSPLALKKAIEPKDLKSLPLLISRQSSVSNELINWSGMSLTEFTIVGTYNLLFNASLFVSEGAGYALCLDKLIYTDETSSLCFRPLLPELTSKLSIVWKKNKIQSNAAKKFLSILQEQIKNQQA